MKKDNSSDYNESANPESDSHRTISSDTIRIKGHVTDSHNFNLRMFFNNIVDWDTVNCCIRHIFSIMDSDAIAEPHKIADIIEEHGLGQAISDTGLITASWHNLQNFLKDKYGMPQKTWHNLPVRVDHDGNLISGIADYVWETKDGAVIVQFKPCTTGLENILDFASEQYAGWYAGELDIYAESLASDGMNVIDRYIYYPTIGLIAEVATGININLPNKEIIFHVFGIRKTDMTELRDTATKYCNQDDFSGSIGILKTYPDEDEEENRNTEFETEEYQTALYMASTQGVAVTIINEEHQHIHIDLPCLASIGDVKLAFAYMKALREISPDCEIYLNDEYSNGQFSLCDDNFDYIVMNRLQNMLYLIESTPAEQHIGVSGINRDYMIPSKDYFPEAEQYDLAVHAMNEFVRVQWEYNDYENAKAGSITEPNGIEYTLRILNNAADTFVGICERVALAANGGSSLKIIPTGNFIEQAGDNPYFELVDYSQFVMRKMSDAEWDNFYQSVQGTVLDGDNGKPPRIYVLRWNPAISSYRLDDYIRDRAEFPDGWCTDWSIYEYEEAKKGDHFVMMRVGDGNTGIVYHGDFASDPYRSKDWRRTGKIRYYIDMNCFDATAPDESPLLTADELYAAIPDVDWLHGHSGELLSPENALKLIALLKEKLR